MERIIKYNSIRSFFFLNEYLLSPSFEDPEYGDDLVVWLWLRSIMVL